MPSRKRTTLKLVALSTQAWPADSTPQLNMMRAIHLRAPNFSSARLLGTSQRKYERKKMPAALPKTAAEKPRSLDMLAPAKPMLTRSR